MVVIEWLFKNSEHDDKPVDLRKSNGFEETFVHSQVVDPTGFHIPTVAQLVNSSWTVGVGANIIRVTLWWTNIAIENGHL